METYHMDGCMGSKTAVAHAKYAKCCALKPRAGFAVVEDREVDEASTTDPNYVQHSTFQGKARLRGAHEIKAQSKRTGTTWSELQQSPFRLTHCQASLAKDTTGRVSGQVHAESRHSDSCFPFTWPTRTIKSSQEKT